jgi:hypothetical protein
MQVVGTFKKDEKFTYSSESIQRVERPEMPKDSSDRPVLRLP